MSAAPQDVLLTFGDSLTQTWEEGSLNQRLAYSYCRLDVINRGFGGYNTEWALPILEQTLESLTSPSSPRIALATIWFGANDACIKPSPQHLPIDRFSSNLDLILDLFAKHSPSTSLVLITPPPISAKARAAQIAPRPLDRDPKVTRAYAEAVMAVGKKRGVPVVDLWNGVVDAVEGGEPNVGTVMRDGLHLNKAGYQILQDLLIPVINKASPSLNAETMQRTWPAWDELDFNDPKVEARPRVRDEL